MATTKQKLVASKLVENGGNIGRAMVAVGYSPATAKTPGKLTRSKGWAELMNNSLPDENLINLHSQLLDCCKIETYSFPKSEHDETIREIIKKIPGWKVILINKTEKNKICQLAVPDNLVQLKALDLAYKVKNKFTSPKSSFGEESQEVMEEAIAHIRSILPRSAG